VGDGSHAHACAGIFDPAAREESTDWKVGPTSWEQNRRGDDPPYDLTENKERSMTKEFTAPFFLVILCLCSTAPADEYTVTIDVANTRLALVEATLVPDGAVIAMNDEANQGLERGWSTFVENIKVVDRNGKPLELTYEPTSRWRIRGYEGGNIHLTYNVRLKHDQVGVTFGDNGAAYANSFGVMWAGRALFIAGSPAKNVTVQFRLPDTWKIATPWTAKSGSANTFFTRGTDDLVNSGFFAGTHTAFDLTVGSASIRFALAGENVTSMRDSFSDLTGKYLRYYNDTYGVARPAEMLFIASDSSYWGGEVMGRVISLSVAGGGHEGLGPLAVLSHVISHEIYHLWNSGIEISEEDQADFEWFNEGFGAEYSSYTASLRLGDLDQRKFLDLLQSEWKKYATKLDGKVSLASAGENKDANYDLVYGGGLIAAVALDIQIRHESGNTKNLDSLLPYLLKRFPRTPAESDRADATSLTLEKLFEVTRFLYGQKIAETFERYVRRPDAISLDKVATLGLAPIVFGPVMNTTASVLANYWRNHPAERPAQHNTGTKTGSQ